MLILEKQAEILINKYFKNEKKYYHIVERLQKPRNPKSFKKSKQFFLSSSKLV